MTNLKTIQWTTATLGQHASPRMAARRVSELTGCTYLGENLLECDECTVEIVWMNRKQTGFIARAK